MSLSCMGNASQGEMANSQNLTLNNLKKMNFKFEKIKGGKCTIPGFAPPNLPNFVIPGFPLFKGLPPFPTLCFLPPFPGIPALSLPPISIPIPPLPLIPPIPLPIPGFSLPLLPLLPIFDLGALNFLCGLFSIALPVLDPFAGLNKLISKLNAAIAALNDFLKFCENNAQIIADTQAPETNAPTVVNPNIIAGAPGFSLAQTLSAASAAAGEANAAAAGALGLGLGTGATNAIASLAGLASSTSAAGAQLGVLNPAAPTTTSGVQIPEPIDIGPNSQVKDFGIGGAFTTTTPNAAVVGPVAQTPPTVAEFLSAFNNILVAPEDSIDQFALYFVNEGLLPTDPTIINQVAVLLAQNIGGLAKDTTPEALFKVLIDNNVPSASGFVGFTGPALEDMLDTAIDTADFVNKLVAAKLLSGNKRAVSSAYEVLKGQTIPGASGLEVAILLNAAGIPFGPTGASVASIGALDVARAFFLRHTTVPLTPDKIVQVLVFTGIVKNIGNNINNAITKLSPLPEIVTPTSIADALAGIIAGPAVGSLKAACIAATKGTSSVQALAQIDAARQSALLRGVTGSSSITFLQVLASMSLAEFARRVQEGNNFPIIFPLSIWELIPLLSIKFNVDDLALTELLNNFIVPALFFSMDSLYIFINSAAKSATSITSARTTLDLCQGLQEADFNYNVLVQTINKALTKYSLTFPTTTTINRSVGNALQQEFSYNSLQIINVLGTTQYANVDQLTFILLATGSLVVSTSTTSALELQGVSPQAISGGTIGVGIASPTGLVGDILQSSINITILTKKYSTGGMIQTTYNVVQSGLSTLGSTVVFQPNDISQTLEISIVSINGFVPSFEAVEAINVIAKFATVVNPVPLTIPQNFISVTF